MYGTCIRGDCSAPVIKPLAQNYFICDTRCTELLFIEIPLELSIVERIMFMSIWLQKRISSVFGEYYKVAEIMHVVGY